MCPSLAVDEGLLSPALRKYPGREEEEEEEKKKEVHIYIHVRSLRHLHSNQANEEREEE